MDIPVVTHEAFSLLSTDTHFASVEFLLPKISATENQKSIPNFVLRVATTWEPTFQAPFNVSITVKGGTAKRKFKL